MALSCVLLVLSRKRRAALAVTPRVPAEGLPAGRPRGSEQGPGRRLQRARLWARRRQGLLGARLHPPDGNRRASRFETVLDGTLECLNESNT